MKFSFQEDIDIETEKEIITDHSQILVNILNMLKYEHQLTKIFQIILTELNHLFFNEYQVIKRINYHKQYNLKTYSYQLYYKKSEVKILIIKQQNACKTLHDVMLVIKKHVISN